MTLEMRSSRLIGDQGIVKTEVHEGLFQSRYALISPGQGDPLGIVEKAIELGEHYGVASKIIEEARREEKFSLTDLDEKDLIGRTMNAQPAIYLSTLIIWEVLNRELGFDMPEFYVGYSLGDFASAAEAGVFGKMEGLKLVKERGRAYQKCSDEFPTGMISVLGSTNEQRDALFGKFPEMAICLINSENDNLSIGGPTEKLDEVRVFLDEMKVKTLPNPARGAFHSDYYKKAREIVENAMSKIRLHDAKRPLITRKGRPTRNGKFIGEELVDQTNTAFNMDAKIKFLKEKGMGHLVELAQDTLSKISLRKFGGKIEPITTKLGKFIASHCKLNLQPTS